MNKKEIREIWTKAANEQKDLFNGRIKKDIEKHRKGFCQIQLVDNEGNPLKNTKIKVKQTKHDFKYGANIFMLDEFSDNELNEKYREEYKKYFNIATVPFYWDGLEPTEGKPRFEKDSEKVYRRPAPERCLEYCRENGIDTKLHCLVYDKFIPNWLPLDDMKAMEEKYEERISQIASRYNSKMVEVEVINELICEEGWNYKSVISEKRDIIDWAFCLARKYMPDETLVINEASQLIDISRQDYRNSYFMMVEGAIQRGVCIDKIGVQHHTFSGATTVTDEEYEQEILSGSHMFNPEKILKGLDILAELGLPLELTEVTVPTFGDTEEDEELQADLLDILYTTAFSHSSVDTIVYWNLPDSYAYEQEGVLWNENKCKGGLFHKDMTPKKAAIRLYELFNKRWHTEEELVSDENGYIEFKGFYGEYIAEIMNKTQKFNIKKDISGNTVLTF